MTTPKRSHWIAAGPEGGYFKSFAFDPKGRVYAGGDDSSGVWASDDDGHTWRLITGEFPDATGWWLALGKDGALYVGDHYARWPILRSRDRGESFEALAWTGDDKTSRRVGSIVADVGAPGMVLVGTGFNEERAGNGIFRSADNGASWDLVAFAGLTIPHLVEHDDEVFAAVLDFAGDQTGLYRSVDAGSSWSRMKGLPKAPITALAVSPDGELFVAAPTLESSLWRGSGDGNWTAVGLGGYVIWMVDFDGDAVLAGSITGGSGVHKSENGGRAWQAASGLESPSVMGMARNPYTGTVLASVFCNQGIYRSADGGRTFTRSRHGLTASYITDIAVGPRDGQVVTAMLGTYEVVSDANAEAVRRSTDAGKTWEDAGHIAAHGLSIAVDPDDGDSIYLGTFRKGVWHSTDGGDSFRPCGGEEVVTAITVADGAVLAGFSDWMENSDGRPRLVRSENGGDAWDVVLEDFHAIDFDRHDDLIAAAGPAGVAASHDGGRTWRYLADDIEAGAVALDPRDLDRILVGTSSADVLESRDHGDTWKSLSLPIEPGTTFGVRRLVVIDDEIHVGVAGAEGDDRAGGYLLSTDGGATWERHEDGLTTTHVWGLVRTPDGEVLAGTYGGGVFRS